MLAIGTIFIMLAVADVKVLASAIVQSFCKRVCIRLPEHLTRFNDDLFVDAHSSTRSFRYVCLYLTRAVTFVCTGVRSFTFLTSAFTDRQGALLSHFRHQNPVQKKKKWRNNWAFVFDSLNLR